jgi:hypothetical protein
MDESRLAFSARYAGAFEALNRLVCYWDVVRLGGLPQAVNAALTERGSNVVASAPEQPADPYEWLPEWLRAKCSYEDTLGYRPWLRKTPMTASAGEEPRFVRITTAARGRRFHFECRDLGVGLARGHTHRLEILAAVIERWVAAWCTAATMAAQFRCVRPVPDAEMYERGEEVEGRWKCLLARTRTGVDRQRYDQFLEAAGRRPQLRQLFLRVSYGGVFFSRCTRYPFSTDLPMVAYVPADLDRDMYEVFTLDRRCLGRGDADATADLLVAHLPPGCGPAVIGTVETLARQIALAEKKPFEEILRRLEYHPTRVPNTPSAGVN